MADLVPIQSNPIQSTWIPIQLDPFLFSFAPKGKIPDNSEPGVTPEHGRLQPIKQKKNTSFSNKFYNLTITHHTLNRLYSFLNLWNSSLLLLHHSLTMEARVNWVLALLSVELVLIPGILYSHQGPLITETVAGPEHL